MYKAVFTDMDGTLLRADHSISLATKELIQKIIAADIPVILVSARPIHGIFPTSKWLGIHQLPIVSLNGAYIGLEDAVLFESVIGLNTVAEVHAIAAGYDVTLIFYSGIEWYAEISNAATTKEQKITDIEVTIAPFESLMEHWQTHQIHINKMMAVGEATVVKALEDNLHDVYGDRMNIYTSKPTYLEIMRMDASKTHAVKFMLSRFNISREEVLAIGDNFNDKEMIAFAGTGIAMGNAPDEVKAAADYITDTNQNDGVRKAFEKFIDLQ